MLTIKPECTVSVLPGGAISFSIKMPAATNDDYELFEQLFKNKQIDECHSVMSVSCFNSCEETDDGPTSKALISGILQLEQCEPVAPARIADVVFWGKCYTCDSHVCITNNLTLAQKKKLISTYGVALDEETGNWTCRHTSELEHCPKCNEQ